MVFSIEQLGLLGLFLNTILSASIFPLPSEPSILLAANFFNIYSVFIVAVIGGFIGAVLNYYIGLKGLHNFLANREPKKEKEARKIFQKFCHAYFCRACNKNRSPDFLFCKIIFWLLK